MIYIMSNTYYNNKNIEIVTRAFDIMKRDGKILSMFWNKQFSGLNGQEQQDFNKFYELEKIDHSCVNYKNIDDYSELFRDYDEFITKFTNTNGQDKKILMACEMAFIMIMNLAISLYMF